MSRWTDEESRKLVALWPTHSVSELVELLHRPRWSIRSKARRLRLDGLSSAQSVRGYRDNAPETGVAWRHGQRHLKRIHHPAPRRMTPVLHLDPPIRAAAPIGAVTVLRHQPPAPSGRHAETGPARSRPARMVLDGCRRRRGSAAVRVWSCAATAEACAIVTIAMSRLTLLAGRCQAGPLISIKVCFFRSPHHPPAAKRVL